MGKACYYVQEVGWATVEIDKSENEKWRQHSITVCDKHIKRRSTGILLLARLKIVGRFHILFSKWIRWGRFYIFRNVRPIFRTIYFRKWLRICLACRNSNKKVRLSFKDKRHGSLSLGIMCYGCYAIDFWFDSHFADFRFLFFTFFRLRCYL